MAADKDALIQHYGFHAAITNCDEYQARVGIPRSENHPAHVALYLTADQCTSLAKTLIDAAAYMRTLQDKTAEVQP